jgi:hypothetical protein
MDWLSYYHRNGTVKFPLLDVHAWNTNDHGVNNAEGALRAISDGHFRKTSY